MKSVLITGARGFVGHSLVQLILEKTNWNIICVNRDNHEQRHDRLGAVVRDNTRVKHLVHDITVPMPDVGTVDIILHAGGNPSAANCLADPVGAVQANVIGTLNLLEFARTQQLEKFIYYSTAEVFGPGGNNFDDYARYNSNNPYAATKAAGEELCSAYQVSYGVPCYAVHLINTFGPRCQPERLAVTAIRKILEGDNHFKLHCAADGAISQRRWFHIDDVAEQSLFLLQLQNYVPPLAIGKFNLAGPIDITNLEFIEMISRCVGKPFTYELVPSDRSGHDIRLPINPELIYSLGWQPKYTIEQRMQQTVDWYLNNKEWLK